MGEVGGTPSSSKRYFSHWSLNVSVAMARYSASIEERETVVCFFVFHEMGLEPSKIQKPVVEIESQGSLPN
jgi:hypothetical protein